MPVVPFILESDALVSRDTVNKRRDLRIAVELHPLRKQRVIVGIIRIVLTSVVFSNDGIRCQIQEETGFLSNQSSDDLIQMILGNDLSDHYKCSDPETGTPISDFPGFRKLCLRKVFQEVSVGIHRLSRSIQALTNRRILRNTSQMIASPIQNAGGISTGRNPLAKGVKGKDGINPVLSSV